MSCVPCNSCAAFDFPTKGILQEAVKHVQYWRLKDAQVRMEGGWDAGKGGQRAPFRGRL